MGLQKKTATRPLHLSLSVTAALFRGVFFLEFSSAHYYRLPALSFSSSA